MPIIPRTPRLPRYDEERPFANVCKTFGRLDKVEIAYRHQIQSESNEALGVYIQRMTDRESVFAPCFRRNTNRMTMLDFLDDAGGRADAEHIRLPLQFKLRECDMLSSHKEVKLTNNALYPAGVRDMEMHFSINFHNFWQNNGDAIAYPVRIRNRRRELVTPDNFNLADLFTLQPDNFPLTSDTFNFDTNLFDGERWHDTANVPELFSKQLLFLRDRVESQFPLAGRLTHAQVQNRRTREHRINNRRTLYILPQDILARAGGVAPLFNWNDYYMPHMEVAFDYKCNDAMQIVQNLMMRVLGVGSSASAGFYNISMSREQNIPCLHVNLAKGISIAIYAKMLDRLRIEVRYKKSLHTIFRRGVDENASTQEIAALAIDSAYQRVMKVLKQLPAESTEPLNRAVRMTDFMHHVSQAFGNNRNAIMHFLNSLAIVGSYAQQKGAGRSPCQQLVDDGILQPSQPRLNNRTVQYSVTPPYGWIIETLRARHFED